MQFYLLTQLRESGRYAAVTVTGAASAEAARRGVETDVAVLGFRDTHQAAAQEAQQLNAANGFVEQGCSTCG